MYDELVKALRNNADHYGFEGENGLVHLLTNAADAIENASKAYQMMAEAYEAEVTKQGWIPVTERLPEDGVYVLARYKNNDMVVACVFEHDECLDFWRAMTDEGWCADCDTEPTHWMQLPEPPKEE